MMTKKTALTLALAILISSTSVGFCQNGQGGSTDKMDKMDNKGGKSLPESNASEPLGYY